MIPLLTLLACSPSNTDPGGAHVALIPDFLYAEGIECVDVDDIYARGACWTRVNGARLIVWQEISEGAGPKSWEYDDGGFSYSVGADGVATLQASSNMGYAVHGTPDTDLVEFSNQVDGLGCGYPYPSQYIRPPEELYDDPEVANDPVSVRMYHERLAAERRKPVCIFTLDADGKPIAKPLSRS